MKMDACQFFSVAVITAFFSAEHIIMADNPIDSEQFMMDSKQISDDGVFGDLFQLDSNDSVPFSNLTDRCSAMMHHFAMQGGNFTRCMLSHARPFRLCEKCLKHYTLFTDLYEAIVKDDKVCSEFLLLADRVQVVSLMYMNFKNIWTTSNCDECYDPHSVQVNSTTGVVTYNLTAETKLLQEMQENVTKCFTNSSYADPGNATSAVCTQCRAVYEKLNREYKRQRDNSYSGICMDLVDMMNHTRLMWSNTFGCKPMSPSPVGVIIISSLACLSVFLFYVIMPYAANIRPHNIFRAKRMASSSNRYGSLSEQESHTSLPSFPGSDSLSTEVRRREHMRDKILARNGRAGESS